MCKFLGYYIFGVGDCTLLDISPKLTPSFQSKLTPHFEILFWV